MAKKKQTEPARACADCIHEWACQAWNVGNIHNMDATTCQMHETVKDSAAYLCGKIDGKKEALHGVAYRCPVCNGTGVVYGSEFEKLEALCQRLGLDYYIKDSLRKEMEAKP